MQLARVVVLVVGSALLPPAGAQEARDRFGDPVPPGAVRRLGASPERWAQETYHLAWSPDGKLLAAAEGQGLQLWDARGEAVVRTLVAPGQDRATIAGRPAFSPDGARLVVCMGDGALRVLDVASGAVVRTLATIQGGAVVAPAISAGGLVAWGAEGKVRVQELASGAPAAELTLPAGAIGADVCFSPDGALLAAFDRNRTLGLWEVAGWRQRWAVNPGPADPFAFSLRTLAFSPDGQRVLASARGKLRAFDAATGSEAWTWTPPGKADEQRDLDFACSPDGKTLAVTDGQRELRLLDAASRAELKRVPHPQADRQLERPAFSPDGGLLAVGKHFSVFEAATGRPVRSTPVHRQQIERLVFSPDGEHLASGSSDAVIVWRVATAVPAGSIDREANKETVGAPAFSPDLGQVAVCNAQEVVVRRTATGELVKTLAAREREQQKEGGRLTLGADGPTPPRSMAFSSDGKSLLAGYGGGAVRVWDLASGHASAVPFQPGTFGVDEPSLVWFTKDGLAALLDDTELAMWSRKGKPAGRVQLFRGEAPGPGLTVTLEAEPDSLAISGDGNVFAIAYEAGELVVASTKRPVGQRFKVSEQENAHLVVALSRDGKVLATAGDRDRTVRLWQTGSKRPFREEQLEPFGGWATALAISPDGRLLAVATGTCVYLLPLDPGGKK